MNYKGGGRVGGRVAQMAVAALVRGRVVHDVLGREVFVAEELKAVLEERGLYFGDHLAKLGEDESAGRRQGGDLNTDKDATLFYEVM
jgi:hypothetical protein